MSRVVFARVLKTRLHRYATSLYNARLQDPSIIQLFQRAFIFIGGCTEQLPVHNQLACINAICHLPAIGGYKA